MSGIRHCEQGATNQQRYRRIGSKPSGERADGQETTNVWSDEGAHALALVPKPRMHLTRYELKDEVRFREREREAERLRSSRRQRAAVWLACVRRGTLWSAVSQRRGSCAEAYRRPDLPAEPPGP